MKRILLLSTILALSLGLCGCGGGAGSADGPIGENPGIPSNVQLLPAHSIAQTNSSITLHAKVLDGNGVPVPNAAVTFTNLSPVGELKSVTTSIAGKAAASTVVRTDSSGIATMRLNSTTSGFATIQAEVNNGSGIVRDKKTVFFSDFDIALPPGEQQAGPTLTLDVDGDDANDVFNEDSDVTLLETATDTQVVVRATVLEGTVPVFGSTVTFGTDSASEATFPLGNTATTDAEGRASVLLQVDPSVLRDLQTVLNVNALADNGAFNLRSLFLRPVAVNAVSVFANPLTVESGGTAEISANVTTTAGTAVPDGTTVNFTTTAGGIEPFGQTTGGIAAATFTAPTLAEGSSNLNVRVTATVGGISGSTTVTVTAPAGQPPALAISPTSASVIGTLNPDNDPRDDVTFTIIGGVAPFTVVSSNPVVIPNPGLIAGTSFTVDPTSVAAATTVTLTVIDSASSTVTATVTVNPL